MNFEQPQVNDHEKYMENKNKSEEARLNMQFIGEKAADLMLQGTYELSQQDADFRINQLNSRLADIRSKFESMDASLESFEKIEAVAEAMDRALGGTAEQSDSMAA